MEEKTELKKQIIANTPKQFQEIVQKAIQYAEETHKNDTRYSGNPLILHLLRTALLTTELQLDSNSTISAILHEIPHTEKTSEYIKKNFGKEILEILDNMEDIKKATETTETHEDIVIKYIMSSNKDLRPVIIKILDTLEDIKKIDNIPEKDKKTSLNKALWIYSPLAEYIDLNKIKKQIDEHAFKEYLPLEYQSISKKLQEYKIDNNLLEKYENQLKELTKKLPFRKKIQGRIKSKYSIYNKLKKYEKEWINPNIKKIDDIIAFRILTDTEDSCYLILEKLMDNGELEYDLFDDYISQPKPNGYKAIQFPIVFPNISQLKIEVQIMTDEMYYHNTYGPASHIAYKASKSRYAKPTNKFDWVENIHKKMEKNKKIRKKKRNLPIQCNIFQDEVFVFTPKGKILDLNKGDTVLDFAFKLHSQIGNTAIGAHLNGKATKLSTQLKTKDVVEIKTDKNKKCQKIEMLKSVNSDTSKFRIRNQLSKNKLK